MADDLVLTADVSSIVKARRDIKKFAKDSKDAFDVVNSRMKSAGTASQLAFDRISQGANKAGNAVKTFENTSRKRMRRVEVIAQQAGYQFGDLAIQIQGGTNAAVALGQQGSQLLGFFGPTGAIAGAALAVATGLIAPFVKARKEASDFKETLEGVGKEINTITSYRDLLNEALTTPFLKGQEHLTSFFETLTKEKEKAAREALRIGLGTTDGGEGLLRTMQDELEPLEQDIRIRSRFGTGAELEKSITKATALKGAMLDIAKALAGSDAESKSLTQNLEDLLLVSEKYGDTVASGIRDLIVQAGLESEVERILKDRVQSQKESNTLTSDINAGLAKGAQDAIDHREELQSQLRALQQQFNLRTNLVGLEGKDLLAQKHKNELAALNLKYLGEGVSETDNYLILARKALVIAQEQEMAAFMTAENIKKQAEEEDKKLGFMRAMQASMEELGRGQAERDRKAAAAAREAERKRELEQREKIRVAIQKQNEETQKLKSTADQLTAPFDDFFMALVDGTTSAKDAFRSMAADIIQQLYRILVVEKLVQSISGAIQGAMAGPVQGPNLPEGSYDGGGYTGSGPRSGGLDGKGGFMAMLHPRETVVDHTKGQGAGGTVVNQVFNISANTSDDTKRLITQTIAQASPAIINQSVGAVMNQRRRGGAMKSAFG